MFGKRRAETVSKLGDGIGRAVAALVVMVAVISASVAALVSLAMTRG